MPNVVDDTSAKERMHATDQELSALWFACVPAIIKDRGFLTKRAIMRDLLENAWGADTCVPKHVSAWSGLRPGFGQDDVTALAVRACWGGNVTVREPRDAYGNRYANQLANGEGAQPYDLCAPDLPEPVRAAARQVLDGDELAKWIARDDVRTTALDARVTILKDRMRNRLQDYLAARR